MKDFGNYKSKVNRKYYSYYLYQYSHVYTNYMDIHRNPRKKEQLKSLSADKSP